ncbi:facilitated trehalose transporter Tret1-2 homolog [Procambarus clarkii]|uniref:facilitated trehalose transporter Tret1-2 homolog n=1 Tax=Procambarus clarkii TaxID=6728 RepID=UPI0037421130
MRKQVAEDASPSETALHRECELCGEDPAGEYGSSCHHPEDSGSSTSPEPSDGSRAALLPQVMATVVAALAQVDMGAMIGFAGVTLPQLMDKTSGDLVLDTSQSALFGSMMFLGAMLGSSIVGLPMVRLGQRVTLLLALPLSLTNWLVLATAPTAWLILASRFTQGIVFSFLANAASTYVAELAHSTLRGSLSSILDLSRQIGILLVYAIGSSSLNWRKVAMTCGVLNTVIPFIGLLKLPSSPRWLATRGYNDRALKSLVFFRGSSYDVHSEMKGITEHLGTTSSDRRTILDQLRELRKPSILRYIIIMSFVLYFYHFSGAMVIPTYIVVIVNIANVNISSYLCAVVIGIVRVIGTLFFICVIDKIDRKPLFAISSVLCSLCLIGVGIFFFDQVHGQHLKDHTWLPITCLAVYSFFSVSPIVNVLRSELFPSSVRSVVVPLLYTIFFIGAFTTVEAYPYLVEALGIYGAFWISSGFIILLVVIVVTTIPETRGKTLEEITELQSLRRSASEHFAGV